MKLPKEKSAKPPKLPSPAEMEAVCGKCIYRDYTSASKIPICGYLLITGHRRGCGLAKKCKRFKKGKRIPAGDFVVV